MKSFIKVILFLLSILVIIPNYAFAEGGPFEKEWSQVYAFEKKGLWKSANDKVIEISEKAKKQQESGEVLKALIYRSRYSVILDEFSETTIIVFFEKEIEGLDFPANAIAQSLLAEMYMEYLSENRWSLMNRSDVASQHDLPIEEWSSKKLHEKICELARSSISETKKLQQIRIEKWATVVKYNDSGIRARPWLYDMLGHRTIEILERLDSESAVPNTGKYFNRPVYLSNFREYSMYRDELNDTTDIYSIIHCIYQELTQVHLSQNNVAALIDLDLKRLNWVFQNCRLSEKESLFLSSNNFLLTSYKSHPASSEVAYAMANHMSHQMLYSSGAFSESKRWYLKRAKEILDESLISHVKSPADTKIRVLIDEILKKELRFESEDAVIPNTWFKIKLEYRNTDKVYFRLIAAENKDDQYGRSLFSDESALLRYLKSPVLREWSVELPVDGDFRAHFMEIPIQGLEAGQYILIASASSRFETTKNGLALTEINSSLLSYNSRTTHDGLLEIITLNRSTGVPMKKVEVETYFIEYNNRLRSYNSIKGKTFKTDNDGYLYLNDLHSYVDFYLVLKKDQHKLRTDQLRTSSGSYVSKDLNYKHWYFTDRAIYRPGQQVFFKMISEVDSLGIHNVMKEEKVRVQFIDRNNVVLETLELKTNNFGSCSGSFRIPLSVLNGVFSIESEKGRIDFSVEEYKRPTFEVKLENLKGITKLNKPMDILAQASTYSGIPLGVSEYSWTLERYEMPKGYVQAMRYANPYSDGTLLSSGKAQTDVNGRFNISCTPFAAYDVLTKGESSYFVLSVTVVDAAGESHSLSKGYFINELGLDCALIVDRRIDNTKPFSFEINATNAESSEVPISGTISINKVLSPNRALKPRHWSKPDKFMMTEADHLAVFPNDIFDDEDDVSTYLIQETIWSGNFDTGSKRTVVPGLQISKLGADISGWGTGMYKIQVKAKAEDGTELEVSQVVTIYSSIERELAIKTFLWVELLTPTVSIGDTAILLIGTSEKDAQVYCEITCKGESINRKWILLNQEQRRVEIPVSSEMKGGFYIDMFFVKSNRCFREKLEIEVPFLDKRLDIEWFAMRDRLTPDKEETINLSIKGLAERETAELLASMYDASLDSYAPHLWRIHLYPENSRVLLWNEGFGFGTKPSQNFEYEWNKRFVPKKPDVYKKYPFIYGIDDLLRRGMLLNSDMSLQSPGLKMGVMSDSEPSPEMENVIPTQAQSQNDVSGLRTNLNETAFFFPHLLTDKKGNVTVSFKGPQAITRWKLMTFVHTDDLRIALKDYYLLTQKDLVVKPNLPRFFREGDKMTISTRVSSLMEQNIDAAVALTFYNPLSGENLDKQFSNLQNSKMIKLINKDTRTVNWDITIPQGMDEVAVRIMASSGKLGDGEEVVLPILSNRELLHESLRFYTTETGSKTIKFNKMEKLLQSGSTVKNVSFNVEVEGNPAWNVVKALPYLMDYPYQCMEQEYSRLFANLIGVDLLHKNTGIMEMIKTWTKEGNLSELEKNPDLKSVKLQNSPWVLAAESEKKQRARMALMLDMDKMKADASLIVNRLLKGQLSNGGWPWFSGMRDNEYITAHILTGLVRLNTMGILKFLAEEKQLLSSMNTALNYLEARVTEQQKEREGLKRKWNPSNFELKYIFCKVLFKPAASLSEMEKEILSYFKMHWLELELEEQARLGIVFSKTGMVKEAIDILESLKQRAIHSDELGVFWKSEAGDRLQGENLIYIQSQIINFFVEMGVKDEMLQNMTRRLIMDKQVNSWETTIATTEACLALMQSNTVNLNSNDVTKVLVAGKRLESTVGEKSAGLIFNTWKASEINTSMSNIELVKSSTGLSYGAAHFQYTELIDKATHSESGMKLMRVVLREKSVDNWEELKSDNVVKTGDRIRVRLTMTLDRNMEYLHLRDLRAAGLEPGVMLSGYRYSHGLGYYQNIGDVSMEFFFDYLAAGTHVLEYDLYVSQMGEFNNGFAEIESMYAPSFRARTVGGRVVFK